MQTLVPPKYSLVNLGSIKAMFDWCYMGGASESYWNGFTATNSNASMRHSFDHPTGTNWSLADNNPIYNDSTTNTSYYMTYCGTRIELNSTWMDTNPTWQYDLNACMNWMPYNTYKYTFGSNTTKDKVDTLDIPLFQHTWYENNICHFDNSSSYYPCSQSSLNNYFNRMECGSFVTSNYTSNNPSYHAFAESYRDTFE